MPCIFLLYIFLCKYDFLKNLKDMAICNLKYVNIFLKERFLLFFVFFRQKNGLFNTKKNTSHVGHNFKY
jgi:hypothetical protein